MAIRALYESADPAGSIDLRNPGYGFIAAVYTQDALANEDTFELVDGELEFVVTATGTQNAELNTPGINENVAQRVTADQQEPAE